MPPQTRRRATKVLKENIDVVKNDRSKSEIKVTKPRKALADKTNSLSDDNASIDIPVKTKKTTLKSLAAKVNIDDNGRPRRERRLPPRYVDSQVLQNLSNSKDSPVKQSHVTSKSKPTSKRMQKIESTKANTSDSTADKSSPDTNNNGKKKTIRSKRFNVQSRLQSKQSPKGNKTPLTKRLLNKSLSFRVLDDNRTTKGKVDNLDVYEFTFDPNEEPPPLKKKRKRTLKKIPTKPKTPKMVVLKSNYDENVSKAIASLKSKVKPSQPQSVQNNVKTIENNVQLTAIKNVQSTQAKHLTNEIPQNHNYNVNVIPAMPHMNVSAETSIHHSNYASIRVEDIAADFELSDHCVDINYSPVNSPHRPLTPVVLENNEGHSIPVPNCDPLNLQEDSFFNEHPAASSSMIVSARHPLASPWRVEFGNLPVKWHSDTYVKSNMTPAVESSFICIKDMPQKKHVYTNIVTENEPLPEIMGNNPPNLKQPSIISFMREAAEKSANKKKRRRSPSPTKANSIFEDVTNTVNELGDKTPKKAKKKDNSTPNASDHSKDKSNEKENLNELSNKSVSPAKVQRKKDKDCTYFGFDDSENLDQENVSPLKTIPNTRTKGLRSRGVLQDFNARINQAGPMRAVIPVAAKAKVMSSKVADQMYDQLKSTEDAQFPEKESAKVPADDTVTTNIDDSSWREEDDSQSVHLFEDIEVVHHLKPHRKSYGKAKKVTFQQNSNSDSDSELPAPAEPAYSGDDDLADLTFHMPNVKQRKVAKKKKRPKKQLSKKEEKEVEEWAAGFNSMCEDVDEFALVVE